MILSARVLSSNRYERGAQCSVHGWQGAVIGDRGGNDRVTGARAKKPRCITLYRSGVLRIRSFQFATSCSTGFTIFVAPTT